MRRVSTAGKQGMHDKWIEIALPQPFARAMDPLRDQLGWRFRDDGGRHHICLEERYLGTTPRVMTLEHTIHAGTASDPSQYKVLEKWAPQDHYLTAAREVYPYLKRLESTGRAAGRWAAFMLAVLSVPDRALIPQVQSMFEEISREFPEARLHVCRMEPTFNQRMAAVRGLFTAQHTPEVLERRPFEGFPSSRGLIADLQSGLRSYISPLLLGRMPFVLGVTTSRSNGLLILNFGRALEGVEDMGYSGLYQLFVPSNFFSRARLDIGDHDWPDLRPEDVDDAIRWWVSRLNGLLGTILDPAAFPGKDGLYSPSLHLATHLSLERFAASVTDILAYELTDQFVRKVMFFDALDLLEGMGRGDYQKTLNPKKVGQLLNELETRVPESVAKIVLGRCRRGLEALLEVQAGFFVRERISDGKITLVNDKGQSQPYGLGTAAAQYLRLIRNSTHSFIENIQKPFGLSLLASHTGDMPSSLADLPLLYFVELLVDPDKWLRRRIA